MISVIIPHYPLKPEHDEKLERCIKSLSGYDELVLSINHGDGFAKSVNTGLKDAKGDYLMVVSNDTYITTGDLASLCDSTSVTTPRVNNKLQEFWGCFFCLPRWVYEQIGGLDESFGFAYFEDDDYIMRLRQAEIPMKPVPSVKVSTEGGQTIQYMPSDYSKNQELFIKKWGVIGSYPVKYDI